MSAAAYPPSRRLPGGQVSPLAAAWRLFMLWESRRFAALACVAALGVSLEDLFTRFMALAAMWVASMRSTDS